MKNIIPLFVVGFLVLSGLGAVVATEDTKENFKSDKVFFSKPIVIEQENYIKIDLTDANSNSWETDKPELPVVTKVYTFPFGTHIDNVEVTFFDIVEQKVSKLIRPSPKSYPISINAVVNKEPESVVTYSDLGMYPEQRYSYSTGAGLKNEESVIYLSVSSYPIQYNPKQNTIYYAKSAKIDIKYTLPENLVTFPDEYDFLILAPDQFKSSLQPLVDLKNGLNPPIKTITVTLNDIYTSVYFPVQGIDDQEKIKYFIRDAKENWGITYVLIVGAGVEGQELFPVRKASLSYQNDEPSFPCDLYFVDIYNSTGGFPDWDKDGDGKYGEYADRTDMDVIPDVYLGRLPCNNVEEVNTIVNKIIDYKEHNKMTKKILQAGGDSFTEAYGDDSGVYEGEYANTEVMKKLPGYSTTQLWASREQITKGNIAKGYNSGVDFIDFSGHGAVSCWATHAPLAEETDWVPKGTLISTWPCWWSNDFDKYNIKNGVKLPVCFYNACSNNKYNKSDQCFSWKTLSKQNGGGIATFGAAGLGYGSYGYDEVKRDMGWMEVHAFEGLVTNKILGQVWANCVTDYYNTFSSNFNAIDYKTMIELSMFGDPTLPIQDGDDPHGKSVNKPVNYGILEKLIETFPRLATLFELIIAQIE